MGKFDVGLTFKYSPTRVCCFEGKFPMMETATYMHILKKKCMNLRPAKYVTRPSPTLKPFKQWLEAPKIGKAPKF